MADLHADHEIVTKFLLDTCSLRHFVNESAVRASLDCAEIEIDERWHNWWQQEFYTEPMLLCVGDEDVMFHRQY